MTACGEWSGRRYECSVATRASLVGPPDSLFERPEEARGERCFVCVWWGLQARVQRLSAKRRERFRRIGAAAEIQQWWNGQLRRQNIALMVRSRRFRMAMRLQRHWRDVYGERRRFLAKKRVVRLLERRWQVKVAVKLAEEKRKEKMQQVGSIFALCAWSQCCCLRHCSHHCAAPSWRCLNSVFCTEIRTD